MPTENQTTVPSDSPPAAQSGGLPAITLPKGGGAIRGIGEKFAANPVTGTGSLAVPIATSPGRSGFGPQLSLSYDSGSGNGPFGYGWSLNIPSITRKTDKGLPRYGDGGETDVFILSGSEDLVPVLNPDGTRFADAVTDPDYTIYRYRPRVEGLFARIERWTRKTTGATHWRSISRDNVTTLYGLTNQSRIFDPDDPTPATPTRVFCWLICQSFDDKGNAVIYDYAAENGDNVDLGQAHERNRSRAANRYLKRISYGNRTSRLIEPDLSQASWLFEVVFDYEEGHYEDLPLDPTRPEAEQHRFVRAAPSAGATWAVRPDSFSSYRAGFEVRSHRRCRRVLMYHHIPDLPTGEKGYDGLVRSTEFDYADLDYSQPVATDVELTVQGSTRFASFIRSVTQSGYVRDTTQAVVVRNGVEYPTYLRKSLPPLELEYSKAVIQEQVLELDASSVANLPAGLDGSLYQWVDLDGEGVSGILTEQAGAWYYKPNLGEGRFGSLQTVAARPGPGLRACRQQLLDLAGDGQLDVVALAGGTPGFYERTSDGDWEPFRAFSQRPTIAWDEPNLRFVDLDGDGRSDVLITEEEVLTWYPSLAEDGFGPAATVRQAVDEERGPRLLFADGTQSIYLADMSGDGLTDLVRVRNGEVCYWPNLGYGRFAAKVTMANAPWFDEPEQFEQRRVRLADIDGSGTNDIIYLGRDGVRLYFNQSGNRWSAGRSLAPLPRTDRLTSIAVADLLGNGTACLVWSSPLPSDAGRQLRYIDLMGRQKPHLLVRSINNLGAETLVRYAASTRFYLEDKAAGTPWITRLPFPVHVVESVETLDRISGNRFVSSYTYHHGYFDGVEREFRGFGRVDQRDTAEFAALAGASNAAVASHVPPVLTKTWFHTGVYLGRDRVSTYFAGLVDQGDLGEYFREPGWDDADARAHLLPDTMLPAGLTVDEEREACRALKGLMLRQEVYGLDGPPRESLPYSVVEQNSQVRLLQEPGTNPHAVFLIHPNEALSYHYERTLVPVLNGQMVDEATAVANPQIRWLPDPRITHVLTLEVDAFGNVLKSASVAYGRRFSDPGLPLESDRDIQSTPLVTYTERAYTNDIDLANDHRTPYPSEERTYQLTGYPGTGSAGRLTASDLVQPDPLDADRLVLGFDQEIQYEDLPAGGKERRLIERIRTLYRPDDLGTAANDPAALLSLNTLEPLAIPGQTHKLAFTTGLVTQVFGARVSDGMLEDEARFIHSAGDPNWWIPSGRVHYSPDPSHTAAQESAAARAGFFLPRRFRDPFHTAPVSTESFVDYDGHQLLVLESRDPLGNSMTVGERRPDGTRDPIAGGHDYRVLQPTRISDPNRNRSAVAFDALGLVAASAVMGKLEDNPAQGDLLPADYEADLTQAEIDAFVADPRGAPAAILLGQATTRVVYDLARFWREPDPEKKSAPFAATLLRETHLGDPAPGGLRIQVSFSYSDGFGREIQKKVPAENGPVPQRDADGKIILGPDSQPKVTSADQTRWVGSGWTVFNNKGKPLRQFEPFFTDRHTFEFEVQIGVSPILCYDPAQRVVATLHPNHTWQKSVFTAWRQETWDPNDTVAVADPRLDPIVGDLFSRLATTEYLPTWLAQRQNAALGPDEQAAAEKAAVHAGTPSVAHADPLGRTFLTIAQNRASYSNAPPDPDEFLATRVALDIEGNQRAVTDPKQRVVMQYDYDLLGNRVRQSSMEAGQRWLLNDVVGKPLYTWDMRGSRLRTVYDQLRRPTATVLLRQGGVEMVVGRTVYGEASSNPDAQNLRGKPVQVFDQAGLGTTDQYDFKGNLLTSKRQFATTYDATLDWSGSVPMQPDTYTSRTRYDALNRPIQLIAPHSDQPGTRINVVQPTYNEANLLDQVNAWLNRSAEPVGILQSASTDLPAVTGIDYDAKGQRTRIDYGNGAVTTYAHDPLTSRLTRLQTRRDPAVFVSDCPDPPPAGWPGCQLQNLRYCYDPVGNVTSVRDTAQQTVFFRGIRVEPSAAFTYDALYRLIEATGREHLGQVDGQPIPHSYNDAPRVRIDWAANDGAAMGRYLERYRYDEVGNLSEMKHSRTEATKPGWTRTYVYAETSQLDPTALSNRLTASTVAGNTETYSSAGDGYDVHGNMLQLPQLQTMQWDFRDQLQMSRRQAVSGDDTDGVTHAGERTWYVYDASGQRIRKLTEVAQGQVSEERIYLGGFEIYRRTAATPLVRETLHLMDDRQRIAMVETRTQGTEPGVPSPFVRYQLGNHLGSAVLELDATAAIISYEEYTPYGSTAYQAVRSRVETPRRYRFTGKERDEESGLYYHGARYYAPWLGRWSAVDRVGLDDGLNLYQYTHSSPVRLHDPAGTDSKEPDEPAPTSRTQLTFNPMSTLHIGASSRGLAFAGDIQVAQTTYTTLAGPEKRSPNVFTAGAYIHSGYLSLNTSTYSLTLGANLSLDRHFSGLGSLPSNYQLQATLTPNLGVSGGSVNLLRFSGTARESLYHIDFSGNVRLNKPFENPGAYVRAASDLISSAGNPKEFMGQLANHSVQTAGLELNFRARLRFAVIEHIPVLNLLLSTWAWGHLGRSTDLTAAGLVAAPAGSLFRVTAPLYGLYTTHTTGSTNWQFLGGILAVPSIEAITKGKGVAESLPTYGFARGSLTFSNVNLGLGLGSLQLSAEASVSVTDLLYPPTPTQDFNQVLDFVHGKQPDDAGALRLNVGATYRF